MKAGAKKKGRRAKSYSQAERIARMMRALASRGMTIREMAEEFAIERRQVYRDIARIEEEGHPLTQSQDTNERTWQLPLNYKGLPPITLSPYELMSLYLAKSHLAFLKGTPFWEDLESVMAKVEAGLPVRTTNHLERIVRALATLARPVRDYSKKKAILLNLRKALLLQRQSRLLYQKPGEQIAGSYVVDPYSLVLYQSGLYLLGYSEATRALRTFAVERIRRVYVTDEAFAIPPSFSVEERAKRLFGVMEGPAQRVRIRFRPDVAYMFKERKWHPTQRVKANKNGSVVVTMDVGGLEEVASWVLSWGPQATVLEPPSLRRLVANEMRAALRPYRS